MVKEHTCTCGEKAKKLKKKVGHHLKGDMRSFRHEIKEDKELMKELKNGAHSKKRSSSKRKRK